jgi:hypothetical protein
MATPPLLWFPTADELVAAKVLTSPDIVVTRSGSGARSPRSESLSDQGCSPISRPKRRAPTGRPRSAGCSGHAR